MNTLYLDIFSGISGDMFIGAMIDLGVDANRLEHELGKLPVSGYHLHVSRKQKSSIEGVKFDVHLSHGDSQHKEHKHQDHWHEHGHSHGHGHAHAHDDHGHTHGHEHDHDEPHAHGHAHEHGRSYSQIKELITGSGLSEWVKQKAIAVFHRIAVAEGKIHGMPAEKVHFHEVGAVDSIVDVVGACIALEMLGRPRVLAGPVYEGFGWINCDHGRFPIPAPATLSILGARGVEVSQCEEPHELITPTGAAILAEFVDSFGPMVGILALRIGYGLGTRDNKTRPNVLRAILGSSKVTASLHDWETDQVTVIETNVDDLSPEVLGHVMEKAFVAGALDVFHTPVQMKKNRPGVLLTILCNEADADLMTELLLVHTTAFGVRRYSVERRKLRREFITTSTEYGEVKVKLGKMDGKMVQASPEYESCREIAERAGVPVKEVFRAAMKRVHN